MLLNFDALVSQGIDNETGLDRVIKKPEAYLKKARKEEAGEVDDGLYVLSTILPHLTVATHTQQQKEPSSPLVDVPDADVPLIRLFSLCQTQAVQFSLTKSSSRRRSRNS